MYDVYNVFGGIKHETFYIPGINYYFNAFTGSIPNPCYIDKMFCKHFKM